MLLAQTSAAPSWHESVTFAIAVVGAGLGIYNAWNARDAKRARKRQESPHFVYPEILIHSAPIPRVDGTSQREFCYPPGYGPVPEDYPDGERVLFRMTNRGGEARLTKVSIDPGLPMAQGRYLALNESNWLQVFYAYSKARRGQPEIFRVSYETVSGMRGEQTFEHLHGMSEATRVKIT